MGSNLYNEVLEVNKIIYSQFADEYEYRTKNAHSNYLRNFIDEFISKLEGENILDLGCGPGRDLAYFVTRGLNAVGVDSSDRMIEICREKKLRVIQKDFLNLDLEDYSIDGIWAYTSHTIIPKAIFINLLKMYKRALKQDTGILALGMIEGTFEGWKSDHKYKGKKRFVARYTISELEDILSEVFGSVWIKKVIIGSKIYLHCICKNTKPANREAIGDAAKMLFNRFSNIYNKRTQTGISLLKKDRDFFVSQVQNFFGVKSKVLDLGCGPGRDSLILKDYGLDVIGLDISKTNIEFCKKKGLTAIEGDIYDIEDIFSENEFDGVWCNCSFTNWIIKKDLVQIIPKIAFITKQNGFIFVGSVLGGFSGWEIDEKYDHLKRYNNHWRECELKQTLSLLGQIVYERKLINTGNKDYLNLVLKNEK